MSPEETVTWFTRLSEKKKFWLSLAAITIGLGLWSLVYRGLAPLSTWLTFELFSFQKGSHPGKAVEFFLYDTPKVIMLLVLIVFGAGILRSFFTPEKTRAFVAAGVPLGVTFSFLIAAPMVNEIAVGLLYGLLGWKVAAIYMATGLFIAIAAGWLIGRLGLEEEMEEWVRKGSAAPLDLEENRMNWYDRLLYARDAVTEILRRVWFFVIVGIAVGAGIHGFVPEDILADIMGRESWWSVPLSIVIGVPMYSNAAGIIPVVEALLGKGAAPGSVLRQVLKPKLIAIFIGIVSFGILLVGCLFNMIL